MIRKGGRREKRYTPRNKPTKAKQKPIQFFEKPFFAFLVSTNLVNTVMKSFAFLLLPAAVFSFGGLRVADTDPCTQFLTEEDCPWEDENGVDGYCEWIWKNDHPLKNTCGRATCQNEDVNPTWCATENCYVDSVENRCVPKPKIDCYKASGGDQAACLAFDLNPHGVPMCRYGSYTDEFHVFHSYCTTGECWYLTNSQDCVNYWGCNWLEDGAKSHCWGEGMVD